MIFSTAQSVDDKYNFDEKTMARFSFYIRYDISLYIDLYNFFIKNNKQQIIDFYLKSDANPDFQSFKFLDLLLAQAATIENLIKLNKKYFRRGDDWELLEFLEDMRINMFTIKNSDKFTRSAKTINAYRGQSVGTDYRMRQRQTLEQISALTTSNTADSQNDWMVLAIQNDLQESDYTVEGGNLLHVTQKLVTETNITATSIVDKLKGRTLYGLDFDKKLTFNADGDLSVLDYEPTFIQSVVILIGLRKGDIPELPAFGVDNNLNAGGDVGSLLSVSLIRQFKQVFSSDDSISNFNITDISYQNRAIYIKYIADSLYDLTYSKTQNIVAQ